MEDQLKNIGGEFVKQAEEFASSDAVTGLSDALKANSGAFANFGKGLVPTGY